MSGFLGMVPEDIESLAADLERRGEQVETIVHAVTTRLRATSWTGGDRDAFEADWTGGISAALVRLATALREAGGIAASNAAQQREASS